MEAAVSIAYPVARVEVLAGPRKLSDFMASAGLGLTGVGSRDVWEIDYRPGEIVDSARVSRAMDQLIRAADAEQTETKILSYRVLEIVSRESE